MISAVETQEIGTKVEDPTQTAALTSELQRFTTKKHWQYEFIDQLTQCSRESLLELINYFLMFGRLVFKMVIVKKKSRHL